MIGGFSLQNMKKGGSKKMEVVYNVKYKFKTNENRTKDEIKSIFNNKLLNRTRSNIFTLYSKHNF